MSELWRDVRYALRMLVRQPGFTAVAVLTLALGIGANAAIFSIVNATVLRPLPFAHADRIYLVRRAGNRIGGPLISMPMWLAWRERSQMFDSVGLIRGLGDVTLIDRGEPKQYKAASATPELFGALGVQPAMGRNFDSSEARQGGANVVILSDEIWREQFGSDPGILGRSITISGALYDVIGVLPRNFTMPMPFLSKTELWLPYQVPAASLDPVYQGTWCIGLLKAGAPPADAEAALTPVLHVLSQSFPKMIGANETARLELLSTYDRGWYGSVPLMLLGAVGLLLLIACANVANLLLARASGRQREVAIRTALGAARPRIVRQLLTESVLLAIASGAAGILLCYACMNLILRLVPDGLVILGAVSIDVRVLVFAFAVSVVTGVVFGLAPAMGASKTDLIVALKEGTLRAGTGRESAKLRSLLIAGEVALAVVLLIGATLLLESFAREMGVKPGYDPTNVLSVDVTLPSAQFNTLATQIAFYDKFAEDLRRLPGVENVAYTNSLPLDPRAGDILFSIPGENRQNEDNNDASIRLASPGYFEMMRIPLERGRVFTEGDGPNAERVAVINRAMADMYWPGQDPIGKQIWVGKPMGPKWTEATPRRIVGIVGDVRDEGVAAPPSPTFFEPYTQAGNASYAVMAIRSAQNPQRLEPAIHTMLRAALPTRAVGTMQTMDEIISASVTDERFRTILLGIFGGLGLLIVSVGVYGVIAYFVAQRTHEIGVRMALGASRTSVLRMVLWQGLRLAAVGAIAGALASLALGGLLRNMLYGIAPNDPATLIGAVTAMLAIAAAACLIPARRATKVDPMVALRYE
jgi:putative ABC transport system permease protein